MHPTFPRNRLLLALAILTLLLIVPLLLSACHAQPEGPTDAQGNLVGQAQVASVSVRLQGDTPPFDIIAEVNGTLPDACTQLGEASVSQQDGRFEIELSTQRPSQERCPKTPQNFSKTIPLEGAGLPAGHYAVVANGVESGFALGVDNIPPTPTPTPTPLPPVLLPAIEPPTATPTPTPTPHPIQTNCTNRIQFVKDVTVPDNKQIKAGAPFIKTWRLKNVGTCTWTPEYALVFAGGEQMGGPDQQPLGVSVKPGKTIDLSVSLTAPLKKGKYSGKWFLQTPDGSKFGLGKHGKIAFWVKIVVPKNAPEAVANGVIKGFVWHDLCAADQASGDVLPPGCQPAPSGGVIADGLYEPGEPPIGGARISLGEGACPSTGLGTVLADAEGRYQFIALKAGDYCVSIDAASEYNQYIFIPGQWTHPPDGQYNITLRPGETKVDINFGWDYELAP